LGVIEKGSDVPELCASDGRKQKADTYHKKHVPIITNETYKTSEQHTPTEIWDAICHGFQLARIREEHTRYTNTTPQEDRSNERLQQSRKYRVATLCKRRNEYRMGEPYQQTLGQTKKVLV
jgi:hypothetical protein